ncbi:MAG: methionine synthase [Ilumatobacteraceae bacterium]|jgi:5-methyltetrahydrofolate--homocysteine methyltransferase|nr:methionine synthase [Ilumatobacteraceae bacterium]
MRATKRPGYLETINERVVVFDGAFGTYVQDENLTADDFGGQHLEGCNELLAVTRPDLIARMHEDFLKVGVDALETATFGSFSTVLTEYGIADRAHEITLAAARIARDVANSFEGDGRPRFVAGSIGPGTKLPSLGHISFVELRNTYEEHARALIEGGVDLLLIETCMDLLQIKSAMQGGRRAMKALGREVPIQVQVTMETTGRMLVGTEIGAALTALLAMKPDVIGINCATGPAEMQEHLRHLSQHSPIPISVLPNAGLPSVVDGRTHYDLTPAQLADFHRHHVQDLGIRVVGGCCGTTPEHLRQVVEAVRNITPARRSPIQEPSVTSLYSPVTLKQDNSVLYIGERTNANGSRAFRDAMLAGDWDTCTKMANEQIREGAHVLDVCVDYVGRDGTTDMAEIAGRFASQASVPLVIDSTEPQVMEAALQLAGGRCILNSANLEDGEDPGRRMDRIFSLARDYGAAVICLLIDERGQARDVEWKMQIAHRLHKIATERYGLSASDLIFDPLTFPLTTGDADLRRDGIESIEGIRRIKQEIPGALTVMGLSNVSFGINPAARQVLNSVFLDECVKAGLDAAIVHASKILPLARIKPEHVTLCRDIIFDKTTDDYNPLQLLLTAFEGVKSTKQEKPDRSGWPVRQRLRQRIIDGDREGLTAELDEALGEGLKALEIVNDVLLDGMREVGELFGSGQMQLPFVLQSAETMKMAVGHLEPHMDKVAGSTSKGKLVLATVKGDVHDIGKNLVDIICTNNGYEVHNIGIKIPISEMITKVQEVDADALGMSGLLVKSTLIMRENLEELNTSGLSNIPVLLGGAALTRSYVERDLREVYQGRVFYGRDAFEGLHTLDKLMEMKRNGIDDPEFGRIPTGRSLAERRAPKESPIDLPRRSPDVVDDNPVFTPPFVGSRVVKGISLDEIAEYVNETALYRNQWQYRPLEGENDEDFKSRIRPELRQQLAQAKASGILVPQLVYGYFPANGDGNDVVIWTDESRTTERMRFSYPRQGEAPFLCIADFFRPVESGEVDYAAFHIVTMGAKVSDAAAELFAKNEYQKYLTVHGLGVEMAEALAEYWHHRIRTEWGFVGEDGPNLHGLFRQQYRGGRYSWGYPACPDLEDNAKVAELLEAGRIGITVNEDTGWQYQPEQTTSAIICHHPRAKYFVAR